MPNVSVGNAGRRRSVHAVAARRRRVSACSGALSTAALKKFDGRRRSARSARSRTRRSRVRGDRARATRSVTCCHPVAVSFVNVAVASSVPVGSPQAADVGAGVAGALVEADAADRAGDVGAGTSRRARPRCGSCDDATAGSVAGRDRCVHGQRRPPVVNDQVSVAGECVARPGPSLPLDRGGVVVAGGECGVGGEGTRLAMRVVVTVAATAHRAVPECERRAGDRGGVERSLNVAVTVLPAATPVLPAAGGRAGDRGRRGVGGASVVKTTSTQ